MNPHIGGMAHPSGCAFPGEIFAVVVFQHALTNEEADRVAAAPFSALFNRQRRPVMYSLPASSTPAVVWNARTRNRQPIWGGVDLVGSPTAGLQYAYNGATPTKQYTSASVTTVGARATTRYPKGLGVRAGSSGQYWSYPISAPTSSEPWTVAAILVPRAGITGAAPSGAGWPICTVADSPTAPGAYDRGVYITNTTLFWQGYLFDGAQKFAVSSVAAVTGRADTVVVTTDGATLTCSVNGVDSSVAVSNCGFGSYSSALFGVGTYAGSAQSDFDVLMLARLVVPWGQNQRKAFHTNPWQLFAPERRPKFFTGTSSGNTYNTDISETATASETAAAVATFLSNISETVAASETMIARAVFGSAVSETTTASDSISSIVAFTSTISETATASETVAAALGAATFAASISETVTASETASALVSLQSAISETATASDSISSLVAFISAVSETATASDTIAAALANQTYAVSVIETAAASDIVVATIPTIYNVSIIETISISDIAAAGVPSSDFWTQISTTQVAGWGQIDNTQSSGWTIIPTT